MKRSDAFLQAYLECALWSEVDDHDEPLDENHSTGDFAASAIIQAERECSEFIAQNSHLLDAASSDYSQHGHDFWLTRNRHGAGFWDRGYPEELGGALTKASQAFGETSAYVGDDGKVHFS